MKKSELLAMPTLRATKRMMELASQDELDFRSAYRFGEKGYQRGCYLRCKACNGKLKVAIFLPEYMRMGTTDAAFEVYADCERDQFLTYDRVGKRWLTAKLDLLPWPSYFYKSKENWIGKSDYQKIKDYFGGTRGGYEGLLDFQLQVRKDQLKRKHKRETDPWDADLAHTPDKPKDWEQWCRKVGIPDNYIFYQYSRKGAEKGYCTYCEQEVPIRNPRHNGKGVCPRCRHPITFKSEGRAGTVRTPSSAMYLIQRYPGGIMFREFFGTRTYLAGNHRAEEFSISENERTIFDPETWERRTYCWADYKHVENRWVPEERVRLYFGYYWYSGSRSDIGKVYGKTIPALARKELRFTGLPEAIRLLERIDPVAYLCRWKKAPILEQLAKAGLGGLVWDSMNDSSRWEDVAMLPGVGLAKTLGIDSQEMKRLRQNQGGLDFLRWLRYEKNSNKEIADHVISWFCTQKVSPEDIGFIRGRMSPLQVCNYLRRQMRELRKECGEVLTTWEDYLSMATRLKLNTNSPAVYRVRNVKKRHDELVKFFNNDKSLFLRAGQILNKYPHVEDICQAIKEKYEFSDQSYTIRVPERVEEILMEGQILSHCVGKAERYWERIERRESYVLFLRRADEPDKPYYTLEIEPNGTIRQQRSLGDEQYEDIKDARQFLRAWQKTIAKRLTPEDLELAKTSKVLRMEEFRELEENQITVRTGKLAGTLLLDVLQKDLMEAA